MRIGRTMMAVAVAAGLAGCGPATDKSFNEATAVCAATWEAKRGNYVDRAKCWGYAARHYYPMDPAIPVLADGKLAVAQKLDKGEITIEEATFQLRKLEFDVRQQQAQTAAAQSAAWSLLWGR